MKGYINGIDWLNIEPMKYWSFPASTSDIVKKETVRNAIFSGEYSGSLKIDGFYQRILKDEDGNCFMIARSRNVKGEIVDKIDWVPQLKEWMNTLPNGTCVLAEVYIPDAEGSKNVTSILGCLKEKAIERQRKNPLHFHIFDCMAFEGKSLNKTPYKERQNYINQLKKYSSEYIHYTEFYEGEELWDKLQEYLASGREGMVIMRKDAIVYNKRTPARVSIKVKQELKQTIDCFIMGWNPASRDYNGKSIDTWTYWYDVIKEEILPMGSYYQEYRNGASIIPVTKNFYNGWAGSLKLGLVKDGEPIYFGDLSGLTEEVLANPEDYKGKVVEVGGMQIDKESHHIRHPRLLSWREDKTPRECLWEQVLE